MEESPEDAWWIEASLKFRRDVLAEFERLVRSKPLERGLPVLDLTEVEVEETESEPSTEQ